MSLSNDFASGAVQSTHDSELFTLHSKLSALYNRLKRSLNYARRCSEGFRTAHWKWSLLRLKISERLSYLCDITRIGAYDLFLETATQLLDDLLQDREMTEDLLTIFNEYLGYAVDIKKMIDDTQSGNFSEIVFRLAKEQYPELLPRVKLVESVTGEPKIFDLISVLETDTTVFVGGDDVLSKTVELLKFLSFHWDIIGELASIDHNRGPVQDINLFPEKFLDSVMWEEKKPSYYDLMSNFSVSSAVKCILNELLAVETDEWLRRGHDKLSTIQQALDNRTKRMGLLMELLISET